MTENDRLLTKEERDEVYWTIPHDATCGVERLAYCLAQDRKTLKAVGEWLNEHSACGKHPSGLYTPVIREDLEAFHRGEMPDDAP